MEKAPKTRKGSRRKKDYLKKEASTSKVQLVEKPANEGSSEVVQADETTPAKVPKQLVTSTLSSQTEEYRTFEWFYHYRFAESDQCVVWGTPQDSPSPVSESRSKGLCNSTTWSPTSDTMLETRKPVRKLMSSAELCEVPDFMSELTAMAERFKPENDLCRTVSSENNIQDNSESIKNEDNLLITISSDKDDLQFSDTQKLQQSCSSTTIPNLDLVDQIKNESFSALFEDDDIFNEDFVRCSQQVEEQLSANLTKFNKEQIICIVNSISPRQCKGRSPKVRSSHTPKTMKKRLLNPKTSPSQNSKNKSEHSLNKYSLGESELPLPCIEKRNYRYVQPKCCTPKYIKDGQVLGSGSKKKVHKTKCVNLVSGTEVDVNEFADDSLTAVLQTFVDDDTEFLSQAVAVPASESSPKRTLQSHFNRRLHQSPSHLSKRPLQQIKCSPRHNRLSENVSLHIQSNVVVSSNCRSSRSADQMQCEFPKFIPKKPLHSRSDVLSRKDKVVAKPVRDLTEFEDGNFLEADVLHFLDSVESSYASSSPPPLQCTPEEIEKKKQEAKQKLEKRRQTAIVGKYELTRNPNSRQSLRPLHSKYK